MRGKREGPDSDLPFQAFLITPSSVIILNARWLIPTIVKKT